jgi:hypothetical protein
MREASDEPPNPACLRQIEQSGPESVRDGLEGNVGLMRCRKNVYEAGAGSFGTKWPQKRHHHLF